MTESAETTRKLDFIVWSDPYGQLETNKKKLNMAIKQENQNVSDFLSTIQPSRMKAWKRQFANLPEVYPAYYSLQWNHVKIYVCEHNRYIPNYTLKINNGKTMNIKGAISFGTTTKYFWTITDNSDGQERLTLSLYSPELVLKRTISDVGESATEKNGELYYLGAEDILWFNTLYVLNGPLQQPLLLYKEKEAKFSLQLIKSSHQPDVYIIRKSALFQQIGIIENYKIRWLPTELFGRKLPLINDAIMFDTYFIFEGQRIDYPDNQHILDAYYKRGNTYCVFSSDATQSIYLYNHDKASWKVVLPPAVSEVSFSQQGEFFIVGYPNRPDVVYTQAGEQIFTSIGPTFKLEQSTKPVPWYIVLPNSPAKGVVICGYGSYGMHIKKYQQRLWIPWLKEGYAVAFVCIRGGGENGDIWWNMGRGPANLKNRVADFTAAVRIIKERYGFTSKNTIIYGRSAGGFLVTAATYELMDEIAATYAAKPYTDLLLTTTNSTARQAIQETDEFGFVEKDPVGFAELATISPYENIPETPLKNPTILLTTGTNDSEVPPAMPVRYAKRLHDLGWKNVFCRVAIDEGHFTEYTGEQGEASDAAILESFLEKASQA